MSPFLKVCEEGNFVEIKAMLQTDSKSRTELLQLTEANGWNCLHWAAYHIDVEWMRYLLTLKELDVNARNHFGDTAFHIALQPRSDILGHSERPCYPPRPYLEMIKMLFEVNNDFVNCCDESDISPLQVAIKFHHFDVVKWLIDVGSSINHKNRNGTSVLHTATFQRRVDCIRYILYKSDCDPNIANVDGWLACCAFVRELLIRQIPSKEQIEFCAEFLLFTYKSPSETVEICFLLLRCFTYKNYNIDDRARDIFLEIVKALLQRNPRKIIAEKILNAQLPSDYCLITLTLFEMIEKNIDNCKLMQTETQLYLKRLEQFKSNFLPELFSLYSAEESLFNECIAVVVKNGWKFNEFALMSKFCSTLTKETSTQSVFNFMKSLLLHDFDFLNSLEPSLSLLPSHLNDHVRNAFVPLSNFVNAPIELMRIFGSQKCNRHYNFNESENCINDYNKLLEGISGHKSEVVSLKNLCRMTVRKNIFQSFTHYNALSMLYSLDIPFQLRQYLCYNFSNLIF